MNDMNTSTGHAMDEDACRRRPEPRSSRTSKPGFVLGLVGSAILCPPVFAQWTKNPLVAPFVDEPFITVPVAGSVAAIQMVWGSGIEIHRLDNFGVTAPPPFVWVDPDPNVTMDTTIPLAGCSLGTNQFALVYHVSGSGEDLRVVMMKYVLGNYVVLPGFPVAINTVGIQTFGFNYSITPSVNGSTIDGAMVAWLNAYGMGPHSPVAVRQQGVRKNGSLVWGGVDAAHGAYVGDTLHLDDPMVLGPPNIVSDGLGLAITTYPTWRTNSGYVHTTNRLGAGGTGTGWGPTEVPGQPGVSRGECFVSRNGSGGAFYSFSNDDSVLNRTDLMIAELQNTSSGTGTIGNSRSHLSTTPISDLLRPLAVVTTPGNTAVFALRTWDRVLAAKFASGATLPRLWIQFLSGATNDNSEAAAAAFTQDVVAITWTRFDIVKCKVLNVNSSNDLTGELDVNGPPNIGYLPRRPQIFPVKAFITFPLQKRFIIGWFDDLGVSGVFADRIKV